MDIVDQLANPNVVAMLLAGLAAAMTVFTLAGAFVGGDQLSKRMRSAALERDVIRAREREKLARKPHSSLRREPKAFMKTVVEQFDLAKHLSTDDIKEKLAMAGYRGQSPVVVFLFFRLVTPLIMCSAALFYVFFLGLQEQPLVMKLGVVLAAAYLGIKAPELYISNIIKKRQTSIRRVFPDALDLLLICVESGMSVEAAFRKVSQEIGEQSVPMAEELVLTGAEMSYLQDRRLAYENLGARTGLDGVKAVVGALIQAERYGTPLSQALRVMAQENRDARMNEAEKKAGALPPKLTIPMIVFFLPVLFVVILGPAGIQIMAMMK
ncbi:type II secretion system F family protein [Terrihabitans rhizophilus]|jgi:tight adherence protein C|uniref:Type II secretion system F family protein n=1 Tax=Terrihabitans rhizophilus TaxID=3092662 RepID=A0ABU4RKC7_9HYPH|nr:type II secretion system F family protein [Terrihabitans sp. PJ23]MDX6804504.1 type II secretion system F family protein [Terrihabitans sp. PJ23]